AWHFERIYNLQRDTILNEWKEKEITELTEKYRTESQEDKIKRQQVQIRYSIFDGIIFLILFVVLVILIFRLNRQRERIARIQKQTVEQNLELEEVNKLKDRLLSVLS